MQDGVKISDELFKKIVLDKNKTIIQKQQETHIWKKKFYSKCEKLGISHEAIRKKDKSYLYRLVNLKNIDGRCAKEKSITDFAKKYGTSYFHISQILNNGNSIPSRLFYKGWYDTTPLLKPIVVIDNSDNRYFIYNIVEFILEHNLPKIFVNVCRGLRPYCGRFRLDGTPKQSTVIRNTRKIYTFYHKGTNRYAISSNLTKLSKYFGYKGRGTPFHSYKKIGMHYSGWILVNLITKEQNLYKKIIPLVYKNSIKVVSFNKSGKLINNS